MTYDIGVVPAGAAAVAMGTALLLARRWTVRKFDEFSSIDRSDVEVERRVRAAVRPAVVFVLAGLAVLLYGFFA